MNKIIRVLTEFFAILLFTSPVLHAGIFDSAGSLGGNERENSDYSAKKIAAYNKINPQTKISAFDATTLFKLGFSKNIVDIYVEPICPACANLENQRKNYFKKAIFSGKYEIRYHFLNFLNDSSPSKNYSSRVNSSLYCLANHLPVNNASKQAVLAKSNILFTYLAKIYNDGFRPEENAKKDHSDKELEMLISSVINSANFDLIGASKSSVKNAYSKCIASVNTKGIVDRLSKKATDQLISIMNTDQVGTPTAIAHGKVVNDPLNENFLY